MSAGGKNPLSGLNILGALLTIEDNYNNFLHDHKTYTTTKGIVKNIYKADGTIRSARALSFARVSIGVKISGTTGSGLMTFQAGYHIATGNGTILDYSDATAGATGLTADAIAWTTRYTIPGIGEGVALYSWFRLCWDLGANYGPSKWFGNDDTKWFK